MSTVEIDVSERSPWLNGLARLAEARATVSVVVEGLDEKIAGVLAEVSEDNGVLIESGPAGSASGSATGVVVWLPVARVVTVTANYQRRDVAADREARIREDAAFLARVREVVAAHPDQVRRAGRQVVREPVPPTQIARELNCPVADVQVALEILRDSDRPDL